IFPLTSYEDLVKPRQQLAKAYLPNGAIYICKISNFLHSRCLFEEKISLFEMSSDESIDIDANDDIRKAERILKEFKMDNKIIKIDNEEIVDIPSENASRARQLYKEEKFLSAIEIFSCKEKRSFFEAIEIIGVCYFKLQRFDETVKYLSKSINKFPVKSSKQAWLYLFNSYFKMNNNVMCFEVAIEALKYKKVDARMAKAVLEAFCMLEESKYLAVVNKIYPLYDEFCYKNNLKVPQRFTQAYAKYNYSLKETYNKKPVDISMEILDKFEVLVPTYQRKEAIISTIRNIKEVNKWIHMRVVDNASTDGTYEALQELAKEYPNLYVSQNEENLGYAGSMVRLLKECSRKFGIFTSDEEPIIVENTIKAIQYMIDDNIDFLSSQFFRKNSFFRGKANNYLMSPEEYMRASFFTSGIIFNMNLLQKYQDIIVKHTPRKQVYPEIIFAIVASIFGKCFWFNLPTAYILKYQLPTHSHDDTEEKSYTCLIERWRQFQRFMQFFQELFQETIEEKYKARIDSVMRHSASEIFFGLKNAAKREYKTLSEYF
ncbi:glycosyltransferase, partial [Helicobacter canadensis]